MNLCLGTVQFGMDYGIRGQKKPSLAQAVEMLDYAVRNGIDTIDTASAYGVAEEVLGTWLEKDLGVRKRITLISKLLPNILDGVPAEGYYPLMRKNLEQTFARLHTDYLDAYLLHSARYIYNDQILYSLKRLKDEGYVRRIGVSVYEVEEAGRGIQGGILDMLQVPFSILDQRMLHGGVFGQAEEKGFPLHSRSAFIQGLALMQEQETPHFLQKARPVLRQLDALCSQTGMSRVQMAMGYVKSQSAITHLVFGVDNLSQLREDIALFHQDIPADVTQLAAQYFANLDADIVIPSLWSR